MSQQAMSDPEIEDGGQPLASTSDDASQVKEVGVGCPPDCAECMEQRQRCPPDCHGCMREEQKWSPDCKGCLKEEARERERRELVEEEEERIQRIEKPWLYETQKPMTEPPDINYRKIIIGDQEIINLLLEREHMPFTERCLSYKTQDLYMVDGVLLEYTDWTKFMLDAAKESGDSTRETFFQDLYDVVAEDTMIVFGEFDKLFGEQNERTRQRAAQRLGIPADHGVWTNGDRLRFHEDDEWVWGWPDDGGYRYRAAQRLGIPENHEEWATEDKRRYVGSDEYGWLWPQKDDLREELQKIDHKALACSSKYEQEAQSEKEPPTVDGEGSTKKTPDLHLDDVDNGEDEAPSPSSDSAERLSNPEIKDEGRNTSNGSNSKQKRLTIYHPPPSS